MAIIIQNSKLKMQKLKSKIKSFKLLKIFVVLVFICSIGIIVVSQASAQSPTPTKAPLNIPSESPSTGINLSLSPVFLNLTTDPGREVTSQFRVTNNNNFTEYLQVDIKKFESSNTGSGVIMQDTSAEDEFVNWVNFSEKEFSIAPNQTKTIRFTISPPPEAALGYYYSFVVQRIADVENRGQGAAIAGATALPVLLEVKSPNAKREIQILDFKTDKLFYEYLPTQFIIKVENSGNVHVSPAGDIFIDSLWNKEIAVIPANKGRGNILPNGTRDYTSAWDDGFAVRTLKTEGDQPVLNDKGEKQYSVKYDFTKANKFRFGKYTANVILVYDNGERDIPLEAQVSFWVVPWKILGVGFVVLLLALLGLRSSFKSALRKIRST